MRFFQQFDGVLAAVAAFPRGVSGWVRGEAGATVCLVDDFGSQTPFIFPRRRPFWPTVLLQLCGTCRRRLSSGAAIRWLHHAILFYLRQYSHTSIVRIAVNALAVHDTGLNR